MSMMDIGIPSGMTPDMDTLDTSKAPMYKRSEMGYRKLSLYFDEVTELCFMLWLLKFFTIERKSKCATMLTQSSATLTWFWFCRQFDSQAQCASIYMANTDKVAEKQPSVIRLYDYYEPSKYLYPWRQ